LGSVKSTSIWYSKKPLPALKMLTLRCADSIMVNGGIKRCP
jgi:hypothetical protein